MLIESGCFASSAAGMARNMTGVAIKMSAAGYKTHFFGKWVSINLSVAQTPCVVAVARAGLPERCVRRVGRRNGHPGPYASWQRVPNRPQLLQPRKRLLGLACANRQRNLYRGTANSPRLMANKPRARSWCCTVHTGASLGIQQYLSKATRK
jgi:hypothetical protein